MYSIKQSDAEIAVYHDPHSPIASAMKLMQELRKIDSSQEKDKPKVLKLHFDDPSPQQVILLFCCAELVNFHPVKLVETENNYWLAQSVKLASLTHHRLISLQANLSITPQDRQKKLNFCKICLMKLS